MNGRLFLILAVVVAIIGGGVFLREYDDAQTCP